MKIKEILEKYSHLKEILEYCSLIVVIAGVPLFFLQQYWSNQGQNKDRVLEYNSIYNGSPFDEYRFDLLEPWSNYDLTFFSNNGGTNDALEKLSEDIVSQDKGKFVAALFTINEFFEGLNRCVDVGSCDRNLVEPLFVEEAGSMFCLYQSPILELRGKLVGSDFGLAIERVGNSFVEKNCP